MGPNDNVCFLHEISIRRRGIKTAICCSGTYISRIRTKIICLCITAKPQMLLSK